MVSYMLYSDLPGVYIMRYIPYVGFATHCRATVMTRLCLTKKKKRVVTVSIRKAKEERKLLLLLLFYVMSNNYNIIPLKCMLIYLKSNPRLDNSGKEVSIDGMILILIEWAWKRKPSTHSTRTLMSLIHLA
jgi:hypothetical protein